MKKVSRILLTIIVIVFVSILMTGCYEGFLSDEQYNLFIFGVDSYDEDDECYSYSNEILQNNIEFDDEIEYRQYCKIKFRKADECKIRGIVFVVRSLETTTLDFAVIKNDNQLIEKTKIVEKGKTTDIDLFFDETIFYKGDELIIEIKQVDIDENEEDKIPFQFDGIIVNFWE